MSVESEINTLISNQMQGLAIQVNDNSSAVDALLDAVQVLDGRIEALETGAPEPPPVEPPPVEPPSGITYTDFSVPSNVTSISGLQSFLSTVPDGGDATHHSRILLGAGRVYTGSSGLNISGRNHITFDGGGTPHEWGNTGGAIIATTGSPSSTSSMAIRSPEGQTPANDLAFLNLSILGTSTNYASTSAGDGGEYQASFGLYGATDIHIAHVMADKCKGDGVYLTSRNGSSGGAWCDGITVDNSTFSNNGRMGIAVIAANNVLVEHCRFTDICYAPLDIEPNASGQGFSNVEFTDNLIDGQYFSWDTSYDDGCFVTANKSVSGIVFSGFLKITDNTVTAAMHPYEADGAFDAHFKLWYPDSAQKTAVLTITGNTCTKPKQGYACVVGGWQNGGTITNNVGFLSSGSWFNSQGGNGTITLANNS